MQLVLVRVVDFNHNHTAGGGGANLPPKFSNAYSSGTESRIDLKLGRKFEFIRCLKGLKIKIEQFGPWKDPGRPFKCKGLAKFSIFLALPKW